MEIIAIFLLIAIWFLPNDRFMEQLVMFIVGGILVLVSLTFRTLTIQDQGSHLLVCFGPWRLFRRRIAFEQISSAEAGQTALIDGLGYHWIPFRGWTLNIAGRDCVTLQMLNGSTIRLGTDDVPGLLAAIQAKIIQHPRDL